MDQSAGNRVLLSEVLELNTKRVTLTLYATGLLRWSDSFSDITDGSLFLPSDVLGLTLASSTITIHSFKKETIQTHCTSQPAEKRIHKQLLLQVSSADSLHNWHKSIQSFINPERPKSLIIFLNPFGGKKLAKKIFKEKVEPLLIAAGINYSLQETQFQRHAKDLVKAMDLSGYDGIVCISGDGILLEVLNGLLEREDWENAIKIPLGVIPAGTGNGMAKSLLHSANDSCDVENATFAIIQGYKQRLDVATVTQEETRLHSVLLLTWGIVADVDIESEKLRNLGSLRNDIYSLIRVLKLRKYSGTMGYIPAPGYEGSGISVDEYSELFISENMAPTLQDSYGNNMKRRIGYIGPAAISNEASWRFIRGEFILVWLMNVPWASEDVLAAPSAKFEDGFLDLIIIRDCPRLTLLSLFLKLSNGTHVNSKYVEYLKVRAFRLAPGGRVNCKIQGGYIDLDGEVLARGSGAFGDASKDPMKYGPVVEMKIEKGLATIFCPK